MFIIYIEMKSLTEQFLIIKGIPYTKRRNKEFLSHFPEDKRKFRKTECLAHVAQWI